MVKSRLVHVVRCKIFWLTSFFCVGVFDFYKGKGISCLKFKTKVKTDDKAELKLLLNKTVKPFSNTDTKEPI